jgi:hypothetical protein
VLHLLGFNLDAGDRFQFHGLTAAGISFVLNGAELEVVARNVVVATLSSAAPLSALTLTSHNSLLFA